MERLLATPKTIPVFPVSDDMVLFGWDLTVTEDSIQQASARRQNDYAPAWNQVSVQATSDAQCIRTTRFPQTQPDVLTLCDVGGR